ncbi:MAG TPA: sigma-70 family RNA polymerase sigma factor [Candidatus Acidoferrales bacterium]|nr:sigma-70 family RNA polymerase sigma factor [Candidatus Acidoferrales bacterium]
MSDLAQTLSWIQDETRLVTELQSGSDTAFDWVVTYYHASVYNVIYGILADRTDAADVTQDVFLKAFRGIHGFRRGSSLKTWLYRIAVRESLNHRRWWHRHCRNEVSIDVPADDNRTVIEIEDAEATPFDQLATRETQHAVRAALAELPEAHRSAVILRDLEGLSYEEVAEVLEISVATVKTRILRGRRALKKILEPLLHAPRKDSDAAVAQTSFGRRATPGIPDGVAEFRPAGSYAMALSHRREGWPGGWK